MLPTKGILAGMAVVGAVAAAGCGTSSVLPGAPAAGKKSWSTHEDKLGFKLEHPEGWKVQTRSDQLILARDGDDGTVVVFPFLSPRETTAEQCAVDAGKALGRELSGAKTEGVRGAGEGTAAARLRWDGGEGAVLCAVHGRSGMLYAIGAKDFGDERDTLLKVLRSFEVTQPKAGGATDGGDQAGGKLQEFTDPAEQAFTLQVPEGWNVEGGLVRRSSVEPVADVDVTSGDQRIFIGDGQLPTFAEPNPTLESTGFTEGSTYSPGYGVQMVVRSFMEGGDFARAYVEQGYAGCEGAQVTGGRDRADAAEAVNSIQQQGGVISQRLSMGEVEFACGDGKKGYLLAGTMLTASQAGGSQWSVSFLYGYTAPEGKAKDARATLGRVVASLKLNPQWVQSQQQLTGDVSKIVADTHQEISDIVSETYENTQKVQDEVYRDWSNAILGNTDVVDPETGEAWKIASGHNYYWRRDGSDVIVGNDTGDRPDINFSPLEEF
jgi:hypothetical protein